MKYCDSKLDNSTHELFERLEVELQGVDNLRLVDTTWLSCEDFKQWLEQVFVSVRARGGRITDFSESPKNSKYG